MINLPIYKDFAIPVYIYYLIVTNISIYQCFFRFVQRNHYFPQKILKSYKDYCQLNHMNKGIFLMGISIFLVGMISLYLYDTIPTGFSVYDTPYFSTNGYVKATISVDDMHIYLTNGCYRLTMTTTEHQTFSIISGLRNSNNARPTTHDIMKDIFDDFGIEVVMAKIVDMRDDTYYARLILKQKNKFLNLDTRPSDTIGIAVRYKIPVYIKKDILINNGENIC